MRYEKGRKDASRRRIMDVAGERFRTDGIAGSGLATIMKDAGLTNGAFYPHFPSKADLVRDTLSDALSKQVVWLRDVLDEGASIVWSTSISRQNTGTIWGWVAHLQHFCRSLRGSRRRRAACTRNNPASFCSC